VDLAYFKVAVGLGYFLSVPPQCVENEMKRESKQIFCSTYVKTLMFLKVFENLYLGKVKGSQLFVYRSKVESTTNLYLDT